MEIKNTIILDTLTLNKPENIEIKQKLEEWLTLKATITKLQEKEELLLKEIANIPYKTIGLLDKNIKITITHPKVEKVIDYDKTLEAVADKENYKYEVKTLKWNDDKIKEELNVIYKEKVGSFRTTITPLKKDENEPQE